MIRIATLLIVLVALVQTAPAGGDIDWRTHEQALPEAAESGKPIIIHFTAEWCSWCTKMKNETYTDPEVARLMTGDFVTAMVDSDHNPLLSWIYGVQSLPTIWILDSEGQGITRINGYKDARSFETYLTWVASGEHHSQSFVQYQQTGS
ncbi:DUF255 domain-containing protein [bacterium]|nr:DUF255 domain-containing protein [bacterium]